MFPQAGVHTRLIHEGKSEGVFLWDRSWLLSLTSQPFPRLTGADDQENSSVCRMRLESGLTEWEGASGVFYRIKSRVPNRYRGFKFLVGPGPGSVLTVCQFSCPITFSFLRLLLLGKTRLALSPPPQPFAVLVRDGHCLVSIKVDLSLFRLWV